MKREVARFDFKAFGQAIKAARKAKGISRNQLADKMNIAPRYIASIENSGQHPSLQIFYELVTLLDVSVDQFFFPDKETDKSTFSPSRAPARRLKIACTLTGYRLLGQTLGKCPKPSMNGKER